MRVLLCTLGSAGDVHPLLGVGRALLARGHRATLVTNAAFADAARRQGLDFVPLGQPEEYADVLADPDLWHPTRGFGLIARRVLVPNIRPLYGIIARHDPAETVVFAAGTCLGARVAQEHLGVRLITHHLAPSLLWSKQSPPMLGMLPPDRLPRPLLAAFHRLTVAIADRALAPPLNAFRRELGLTAPARDILFGWTNSPGGVLGLFPDWFAPPQPDWPARTRLTGFPRFDPADGDTPVELPPIAGGDAAPLVCTAGSANIHARAFFAAAVEASQRLGRPAILLTRHRELLPGQLPPGVTHRAYIPLDAILPRAAALVHHGGIGTTAQGLAAGVPQLVMPMSHDQPDNALRLRRLGVGASLPPGRFTGPRVAAALDRLLSSPDTLARCRDLATRCDPDAADRAAAAIEGMWVDQASGRGVWARALETAAGGLRATKPPCDG